MLVAQLKVVGLSAQLAGPRGRGAEAAGCSNRAAVRCQDGLGPATGGLLEGAPAQMPSRWRNKHDCDRPARWRESTDEECKVHWGEDGIASPSTDHHYYTPNYSEVVPPITTIAEFYAANKRGAEAGRLVVVKFYSKQCAACFRIAAKYRRLAIDYQHEIDCYEAESRAARELAEHLNVTLVPSLQVFDGNGVVRLMTQSCAPKEFKRIEGKVRASWELMKKRPSLLRQLAEQSEQPWSTNALEDLEAAAVLKADDDPPVDG